MIRLLIKEAVLKVNKLVDNNFVFIKHKLHIQTKQQYKEIHIINFNKDFNFVLCAINKNIFVFYLLKQKN